MSDDTCQCPLCGRLHRSHVFGKPPPSIANNSIAGRLMQFYSVNKIDALLDAMERHIARLQEANPPREYFGTRKVRE